MRLTIAKNSTSKGDKFKNRIRILSCISGKNITERELDFLTEVYLTENHKVTTDLVKYIKSKYKVKDAYVSNTIQKLIKKGFLIGKEINPVLLKDYSEIKIVLNG